jgi:hypothetical protein
MYPQVIEEFKTYGRISGDKDYALVASAMEQGFGSAGWKGALNKGPEVRRPLTRNGYSSAYDIATLYSELGNEDQAFHWLGLKTDFLLDPIRADPPFDFLLRPARGRESVSFRRTTLAWIAPGPTAPRQHRGIS